MSFVWCELFVCRIFLFIALIQYIIKNWIGCDIIYQSAPLVLMPNNPYANYTIVDQYIRDWIRNGRL